MQARRQQKSQIELPRVYLSAILLWAAATPLLAFWIRIPSLFAEGIRHEQLTYIGLAVGLSLAILPLHLEGARRSFSTREALSDLAASAAIVLGTITACFLVSRLEGVPRSVPAIHFVLLAVGTGTLTFIPFCRDCGVPGNASVPDEASTSKSENRSLHTARTSYSHQVFLVFLLLFCMLVVWPLAHTTWVMWPS
jgi:hypothetical protein